MTIKLNRRQVYAIGLSIIALYIGLNRMDYFIGSETTTGVVIGQSLRTGAPLVRFVVDSKAVFFETIPNMQVEPYERVSVIYKKENPSHAAVFSFVGFWLYPIIYSLLPFVLLTASVFTFMDSSQRFVVTFGKGISVVKKDK
jgi:hypothetical protein